MLAEFLTSDNQTTNKDGNYKLGLIIKSKKAGQRVDVYGDAQLVYFDDYDQPGWVKGSRNGSISDMACAANVISVGSYNVRNHWPSLDGNMFMAIIRKDKATIFQLVKYLASLLMEH